MAAIRETFEETGILLAYRDIPNVMTLSKDEKVRFAKYRRHVRKDPFSFVRIIDREGLKLAAGNLFCFAHWITPKVSPIRFDARFFVSVAPSKQEALCDALEIIDHLWISPQKALEQHGGDFYLPFPTLSNITVLAQLSSVDEVIASTRYKNIKTSMG